MCCLQFLTKYILFIANLIFALAGITLLGLGIAVLLNITEVLDIIPDEVTPTTIPVLTIVVGSVVFLIAFFGCCGAIKESKCLLVSYAVCMAVLAVLKIALVIVLFLKLSDLREEVFKWFSDAFEEGLGNPGSDEYKRFDELQKQFQCCGSNGPQSYGIYPLPASCCGRDDNVQCLPQDAYGIGCADYFADFLNDIGSGAGIFVIVIIVIEVVAMIMGSYLANRVSNKGMVV